jgi:hypothetical protein
VEENVSPVKMKIIVENNSNEIKVSCIDAAYTSGQVSLYNLSGVLFERKIIKDNECTFNKSILTPGVYIIMVNKSNLKETRKIVILQ